METLLKESLEACKTKGSYQVVSELQKEFDEKDELSFDSISDFIRIYMLVHCTLSVRCTLPRNTISSIIIFLERFSNETTNIMHKIYISKSLLRLLNSHSVSIDSSSIGTLISLFSTLLLPKEDIIFHNVAECIILLPETYWDSHVSTHLDHFCELSSKFHLIFLKYISDKGLFFSRRRFSEIFTRSSTLLCMRHAIKSNSIHVAQMAIKLFELRNEDSLKIEPLIFFNKRSTFKNSSSKLLFFALFREFPDSLSADCKFHAMIHSNQDGFHEVELTHVYDTDSRFRVLQRLSSHIPPSDMFYALMSLISDCSPSLHRSLSDGFGRFVRSDLALNDMFAKIVDCRLSYRAALILLDNIEFRASVSQFENLLNLVLYSGYPDVKILAFKRIISVFDSSLIASSVKRSNIETSEWCVLLLFFTQKERFLLSVSRELDEFRHHKSISSLGYIINVISGLFLLKKVMNCEANGENHESILLDMVPSVLAILDLSFQKCLTDTPESYSLDNSEVDYESRNEWKIIKSSSQLISSLVPSMDMARAYEMLTRMTEIMTSLKHRGAFSSLLDPISNIEVYLFRINSEYLEKYVDFVFEAIKSLSDVDSCTRRSAGLPLIVRSLLKALPTHVRMHFADLILGNILELCSAHSPEVLRIRCANILCDVFNDKQLEFILDKFGYISFDLSFDFLSSSSWAERNVGLCLYSVLFRRFLKSKMNDEELVDIRKTEGLNDIILKRMRLVHKNHIYPILIFTSCLKIPESIRIPYKQFLDSTKDFLNSVCSDSCYFTCSLGSKVSASMKVDPPLNGWQGISTSTSVPDCIPKIFSTHFVSKPNSPLSPMLRDGGALATTRQSRGHDSKLVAELTSLFTSSTSDLKREKIASQFLEYIGHHPHFSIDNLNLIYKIILDDDENIRFLGCQIACILFKTPMTKSPIFYVREIWSFIGSLDVPDQQSSVTRLFFDDFVEDFEREYNNIIGKSIFRSEPINLYRDFYVEALVIAESISRNIRIVDERNCQSRSSEIHSLESGYLSRSIKVLEIISVFLQ